MEDIFLKEHHFIYEHANWRCNLYYCKHCDSRYYCLTENLEFWGFFDNKGLPYNRDNSTIVSCNEIIIKQIIE